VSNEVSIQDEVKVDTESNIEIEIKEKVFARMCQILDEKGILIPGIIVENKKKEKKSITVPFNEYDKIERYIKESFFEETKKDISFFSKDLIDRITVLMILEHHTKCEAIDTLDDIIDAIINPMILKGKTIEAREDEKGMFVMYTLNK